MELYEVALARSFGDISIRRSLPGLATSLLSLLLMHDCGSHHMPYM
jgi:hypothetical protein